MVLVCSVWRFPGIEGPAGMTLPGEGLAGAPPCEAPSSHSPQPYAAVQQCFTTSYSGCHLSCLWILLAYQLGLARSLARSPPPYRRRSPTPDRYRRRSPSYDRGGRDYRRRSPSYEPPPRRRSPSYEPRVRCGLA